MRSRFLVGLLTLTVALAMVAPACAPGGGGGEGGEGEEEIGDVSVMGVWGGTELESFQSVVKGWEDETGGTMRFEGTRDLSAILRARVQGGNPPDIAVLPNPALLRQFGQAGNLEPLDEIVDMDQLREDYSEDWIEQGSVDGDLYGLFVKASPKSTVWYDPKQFSERGYQTPTTWEELTALTNRIREDGDIAPWSIGMESGGASGWPGSDWIQEIFLAESGGEAYDQWVNHEIPWTDPKVKSAFERFGELALAEGNVVGGASTIVGTTPEDASYAPFQEPPRAYMYFLGAFAQGFITAQFPDLKPAEDYDFFDFPAINTANQGATTVGGDVVVMLNDTPSARSLMEYLAEGQSWQPWAEAGGFTTPNRSLDASAYPDPIAVKAAEQLTEAQLIRYDADDIMPTEVQNAFWRGILDYVQNPNEIDRILADIESVAKDAYGTQ